MAQIKSFNKVVLVGRVVKDPEITVIATSSRNLARFTVVTNERYLDRNSNSWKDAPAEFHAIVAWGPLAQRIERSVNKGDLLLVEGKLKSRRWKDQNGTDRKVIEIECSNLIVLEKKRDTSAGAQPEVAGSLEDDLNSIAPFEDESLSPEIDEEPF